MLKMYILIDANVLHNIFECHIFRLGDWLVADSGTCFAFGFPDLSFFLLEEVAGMYSPGKAALVSSVQKAARANSKLKARIFKLETANQDLNSAKEAMRGIVDDVKTLMEKRRRKEKAQAEVKDQNLSPNCWTEV